MLYSMIISVCEHFQMQINIENCPYACLTDVPSCINADFQFSNSICTLSSIDICMYIDTWGLRSPATALVTIYHRKHIDD